MGCKRTADALQAALENTDAGRYFHGLTTMQLIDLLCS